MSKKKTTEEFIADARRVHGDKFDYSKVDYKNNKTKVCIICSTHGEIWKRPDRHLQGDGCSACSGKLRKTNEDFIADAIRVHGDLYDYSKIDYKNNNTPVTITCKEHGDFKQAHITHVHQKSGCPKCASNHFSNDVFIEKCIELYGDRYTYEQTKYLTYKKSVTITCREHGDFTKLARDILNGSGCHICNGARDNTDSFIKKATAKHKGHYSYEKVDYVNNKTSVNITCKKHGSFLQKPSLHMQGHGCPICSGARHNTYSFIEKATLKHKGFYSYENTNYVGGREKVTITCPNHGDFIQTASTHLRGYGCKMCSKDKKSSNTNEFIKKATVVHDGLYSYENTEYIGSNDNVSITCKKHGSFSQRASGHLKGQGCPECAKLHNIKRYYDKPTVLYFIKFSRNNQQFLKVGITTQDIQQRFKGEHLGIQTLQTIQFKTGLDAYTIEQYILNKYARYKTLQTPLANGGNSEVLNYTPVLEQDIKSILKDINVRNEKNRRHNQN